MNNVTLLKISPCIEFENSTTNNEFSISHSNIASGTESLHFKQWPTELELRNNPTTRLVDSV